MELHELTAGYALDALDPADRERYEAHLATCERCREELQGFWQVAGALGLAAGGPQPPAALRERILDQARKERPNVVPLRRPRSAPVLSFATAAAALVAVGLGIWSLGLSNDLDEARDELTVLGNPDAQRYETAGGEASLVVAPGGEAALVVRRLAPAPAGKDYEIWVFENGIPRRAGVFERRGIALLERSVEPGQTVAVTLERDGGVDAPTGAPIFTASSA